MPALRLPNFFLIGAPKAGSTSLYHYLDQHPQIYMSPIKEPNFFASEVRAENFIPSLRRKMQRDNERLREYLSGSMHEKRFGALVTNWEDYLRLFANAADEPALGEASVCYLWSPTAPARIAEAIPDARILAILRDPAERAFSQYLHGLGRGLIRWSFREHIRRSLRRHSSEFCPYYPFLEMGLYSEQIERYTTRFGPNVWIGLYEDVTTRPEQLLQDIFRFLGVTANFTPDMRRKYLQARVPRFPAIGRFQNRECRRRMRSITPASVRPLIRRLLFRQPGTCRMEPADRKYLVDFYRQDVARLARILNRDLENWMR